MGMTVEEFAAGCDWAAVREAVAERRVELRGQVALLDMDVAYRSRPNPAMVERLEGLRVNLALVEEHLQLLDAYLGHEGGR